MEPITQQYYNLHAQQFTESTLNLDMQGIYQRFLSHLAPQAMILDAGCGPGRDSKAFKDLGYQVKAIDACLEFVEYTRQYAGVEAEHVRFQDFQATAAYDGIWASASLLHLQPEELPRVLKQLAQALKPQGVFYASFKQGEFAGERHGRWFTDMSLDSFQRLLQEVPVLQMMEAWKTEDMRPGRQTEIWLNVLLRKSAL